LHVATKAPGQSRTLYLAFDYGENGRDVSAIRAVDRGRDNRDKCSFITDQQYTHNAPVSTEHRSSTNDIVARPEQNPTILLINNTHSWITEIYASEVTTTNWGTNVIYQPGSSGSGVASGQTRNIAFHDYTICRLDLMAVDSEHRRYVSRDINVCNGGNWTLTD
jgi:hypothetical protein